TVRYAELDERANRLSRVFHDLGLRPGDHVAFCLENGPEFLVVCWGAHYAGLVYTAISTRLTTPEMAYILDNSGARAFIASPHVAEQAAALADRMPDVVLRLSVGGAVEGYESYEEAIAAVPADALPDRVAGCDMLYSSGTTGRPKGVLPAREDLPLEEAGSGVAAMGVALFGVSEDSVDLSPAPLYHAAPLRFCMGMHVLGATVVVMDRFGPGEYLATVERFRVTHSQVVPTMFVRMLKLPEGERTAHDVSSLECVIHAAAPCPVPVKEQMIDWWGPIIHEYYAGTEGNGFCYCDSEMWMAHKGTVGMPINCEVHIVDDETGEELPPGAEGTVYFGGGGTFEYLGDPGKTADSRHPNGWSTLGDVGRLDTDGFLHLTDRKAYMIISGGVNIYPQEAENVLTVHPAVHDVAVIGVPHEELGEEVKAVVQPAVMPADDAAARRLERELIEYCRANLSGLKCPRSIDFRPELPRQPTGKLYKRLLRDEYWGGQGSRLVGGDSP
ncbi:MAG: acyl-CoA synthetase, partial [Acidimicrobiales bacterium]